MDTENLEICRVTRDFTRQVISSGVKKFDVQPKAGFPSEAIIEAQQIGLTRIVAPEEWGGSGNFYDAGSIVEELASCCPGFAIIVANSLWSLTPLVLSANETKAKQVFDTYFSQDQAINLATSILPDTGRELNISARPEGKGYILDGQAACVFTAGVSGIYIVFADASGTSICGVLPASAQGLRISDPIRKLGLNVALSADIKLEHVLLEADHLLAAGNEAKDIMVSTEIRRHSLVAAAANGCAKAALRESIAYANQRRKGGKLIARHDAVAAMLGHMQVGLESSQSIVDRALKHDSGLLTALSARIHATDTACEVSKDAVQIFGGYGYMIDLPVEKLMRDSQQLALIGGSNPWLRVYLGSLVSG